MAETLSSSSVSFDDFLSMVRAEAADEAVNARSDAQIETDARAFWDWATNMPADTAQVRLRESDGAIVLETTGPDRPFLVDSLLGVCAEQNHQITSLYHPILNLDEHTRRSFIQIVLSPMTDAEQTRLLNEAEATLNDVVGATSDYSAMKKWMTSTIARLQASPHVDFDQKSEALAFLEWLESDHFVFLGARDYVFPTADDGSVLPEEPNIVAGTSLGILRDENRNVLNRGAEPLVLSPKIGAFLSAPEPLILTKATMISRVHRRVACDYVGVKHFDEQGRVTGETRFLGLYTAEAYDDSVKNIPLIRKRVSRLLYDSGAIKGTYNEKALSNILESWPRDELFQTNSETLAPIMRGVLSLVGRPRVRLFVRPDRFLRFVIAIVFVPREAYDTALRERITSVLEEAYEGRLMTFQPRFDASNMVRVIFEIALPSEARSPDIEALEAEISELSKTWDDRFRSEATGADLPEEDCAKAIQFHGAFNAAYREAFGPAEAMRDVTALSCIGPDNPVRLRAFRVSGDPETVIQAKIYSRSGSIALSDCVPIFERMGLFVEFETGYPVAPAEQILPGAPTTYWIHALQMRRNDNAPINLDDIAEEFEEAFAAIWSARAENDEFNALVFNASLTWREAALLRALCAYRYQSGLDPARAIQIEALNTHPDMADRLLNLFALRFDPSLKDTLAEREDTFAKVHAEFEEQLKTVASLDHDRVIRRLGKLIGAIQRTNFYCEGDPHIAFKIASSEIDDLPAPKPFREIFMSSPMVEGVHCRFGKVARGGLRWSDRRDDFRTEVLGLVKAQQVKNAVIVPVGSKGGFFPKHLPLNGTREEVRAAGIAAYKSFITALLGLTDNLIDGDVRHPKDIVVWDGEDPYLVVAADKGTATFSDIANEISTDCGFWLGDAFASGGSAGYDHKKMGITARGAWEAVKRHFRELGKDIQTQPFTVIGCGDMSGDVFGNGMLLSKHIRLQAAFNHLHIFIDPDPLDTERLWEERQRLFDLPRSSWGDYDTSLISKGGGVFERSAKSIELTQEIKDLTGLSADAVTPDELLHALLKAPCELLWFGGIGTYIKAAHETHQDAGDRANDGLRIDGRQARAKVIGEGANLGLTQAGRIEFAQAGGRLNTDAIDNSAGVDSSDHEVNIKILCAEAIQGDVLKAGDRNALLASMTDAVADKVLAHNYAQTRAMSLAEARGLADHDGLERLMVRLERRGVLDRQVEGLPSTAEMAERQKAGSALTRPEIAVLMAWTKIVLFDDLVASNLPDDTYFKETLSDYFPDALGGFSSAMDSHRLKREIIATIAANRAIDLAGPIFFLRLREQSDVKSPRLIAALETACNLLHVQDIQKRVDALDNAVSADQQSALHLALSDAVAELTLSIVADRKNLPINDMIIRFGPPVDEIRKTLPGSLNSNRKSLLKRRQSALGKGGVPSDLAKLVAESRLLSQVPRLCGLAEQSNTAPKEVFETYQTVGHALGLDRLRSSARSHLEQFNYWDRLATRRLIDDMIGQQVDATRLALSSGSPTNWLKTNAAHHSAMASQVKGLTSGDLSFAKFALAGDAVRELMRTMSLKS